MHYRWWPNLSCQMLKARWLRVDDRIIAIEDQTNQNSLRIAPGNGPAGVLHLTGLTGTVRTVVGAFVGD